jgi:type IV pilus assembly protein PilW
MTVENCDNRLRKFSGMTLIELLIAMLIGSILLAGLLQIAISSRSSFRLQEGLAEVQENGRFLIDSIADIFRQSGYNPEPWVIPVANTILLDETSDAVRIHGDRVAIRGWSDRNCFGNLNPVTAASGQPEFFIKESVLEQNASRNLAHTCRYGPATDQLTTQIQRQGLAQNVEALQLLYAEDLNADGEADRWVPGGSWADEKNVIGLQLGLLLRSSDSVIERRQQTFNVLDHTIRTPADGRLRRVFTFSTAFRGLQGW